MSVDWSKPIQTRNGRKAKLIGSWAEQQAPGRETRAVAISDGGGSFVVALYFETGQFICDRPTNNDIINVPPRTEKREVVAWAAVDQAGRVLYHGDLSIAETVMSQRKTAQLVRLTGTYEVEVQE